MDYSSRRRTGILDANCQELRKTPAGWYFEKQLDAVKDSRQFALAPGSRRTDDMREKKYTIMSYSCVHNENNIAVEHERAPLVQAGKTEDLSLMRGAQQARWDGSPRARGRRWVASWCIR